MSRLFGVRPLSTLGLGRLAAVLLLSAGLGLAGCSSALPGEADAVVEAAEVESVVDEPIADPPSQDAPTTNADVAPVDPEEDSSADGDGNGETNDAAETFEPPSLYDSEESDKPGTIPGLESFLGEGGCLAATDLLMGWGFTLLGPLMEGTPIEQSQVDELLAATADMPTELQPHVAVLRDALHASVGQPQAAVVEIVGALDVTKAMEALGDYTVQRCDADS